MISSEPQFYRLFTFHLDGKLYTLTLEHVWGLTPEANAAELYRRFHTLMEREAPGCFRDGRISHLGYVDGTRQQPVPGVDGTRRPAPGEP